MLILVALLLGGAGGWLVQQQTGDPEMLLFASTASLLCLVPAVGTLLWVGPALQREEPMAALMHLAGTAIRILGVLSVTLILVVGVEPFRGKLAFLFWVAGAYFLLLTVEIVLLVGRPSMVGTHRTGLPSTTDSTTRR